MGIWPAGYTVGLISVLLDQPRPVCVESVEPTVMLVLRRFDVFELMRRIPTFALNISRLTASIAAYGMDNIGPLVLDTAAVRLCRVLESLATKDDEQKELVICGLKQEDLASLIGVSRTWVTLMLSDLERRGVISRRRQKIGILNLKSLRKICQEGGSSG
jgi:CRP-like cAMP-binding protein